MKNHLQHPGAELTATAWIQKVKQPIPMEEASCLIESAWLLAGAEAALASFPERGV